MDRRPLFRRPLDREETLEGVLDRLVYSNEETGWSVARILVRGKGEVTAVGNLLGVRPGESLRLTGRHVRDRKFGRQFQVSSYLTIEPATFVGLEKYLGSGLVQGIGPTMAKRLVKHFGLETLDVIDRQPERLAEVEGIGPKRSELIREAWSEQREVKNVMVFLQSHGISTAYAVKIYKRYGSTAIARVRENPFRLAEEVHGIGFMMADKIARDLGIPPDSPHRADAGVLYLLRQAADRGHVFVVERELAEKAAELLDVSGPEIGPAVARLTAASELARHPLAGVEQGSDAILLVPLDAAEAGVASRVTALAAPRSRQLELHVDRAIAWFEEGERLTLAPAQRHALEDALRQKFLILTGGPGTGKTTLTRGIVRILEQKGLRIELAAPTGRAAKRLAQATGRDARTVHRLLEYSPQERRFSRRGENPLEADLIIVDEASMLDVVLAHHLLDAVRNEARMILVGDVDQLPSVGPGRVLADLIDSRQVPVVRLTEIFRQARESLIVRNAHRVCRGEIPHLIAEERGDFFFIERDDPAAALVTLKKLVAERIPRGFGFKSGEIQILTPMQRGLLGAVNINAELQALLNPGGEEIPRGQRLLKVGDRVMQVRNNYELEVYNGDVGRIAAVDLEEQTVRVDFDERSIHYALADLDELTLAYACSIHKSQGSEYTAVVIPLATQHFVLLQRNLLYTAITRGKRLVVVVGSRQALELAVHRESTSRRETLLVERLQAGL